MIKESQRKKKKKRGREGGERGSEKWKERKRSKVLFKDFIAEIQLDSPGQVSTVLD